MDQVLAAARGAGLPIEESRGQMVLTSGPASTTVAILSRGNAVYSRAARVAGDEMDAAIAAHVGTIHQLLVGEPTAERLKMQIGSAVQEGEETSLAIKGRCALRGVPREATIRGSDVFEALSAPLERIMNAIREALENAPPELSADLVETGIVLTGGSVLLRKLDLYVSRDGGLPVRVADDPLSCVIQGLARQLNGLGPREWRRFGNGR